MKSSLPLFALCLSVGISAVASVIISGESPQQPSSGIHDDLVRPIHVVQPKPVHNDLMPMHSGVMSQGNGNAGLMGGPMQASEPAPAPRPMLGPGPVEWGHVQWGHGNNGNSNSSEENSSEEHDGGWEGFQGGNNWNHDRNGSYSDWFNVSKTDRDAMEACREAFNISCIITLSNAFVNSLNDSEYKTRLQSLIANFTPPAAVISLFDSFTDADREALRSHNLTTIKAMFEAKIEAITDPVQRTQVVEYIIKIASYFNPKFQTCFGPALLIWSDMTQEQRNSTQEDMENFNFAHLQTTIQAVVSTMSSADQNTTNAWLADNMPPPALLNIFSSLNDTERAMLTEARDGDHSNAMGLMQMFQEHMANCSPSDMMSIMMYFGRQAQCMMSDNSDDMGMDAPPGGMQGGFGRMPGTGASGGIYPPAGTGHISMHGGSGGVMQPATGGRNSGGGYINHPVATHTVPVVVGHPFDTHHHVVGTIGTVVSGSSSSGNGPTNSLPLFHGPNHGPMEAIPGSGTSSGAQPIANMIFSVNGQPVNSASSNSNGRMPLAPGSSRGVIMSMPMNSNGAALASTGISHMEQGSNGGAVHPVNGAQVVIGGRPS